jgi:hypothetical protein
VLLLIKNSLQDHHNPKFDDLLINKAKMASMKKTITLSDTNKKYKILYLEKLGIIFQIIIVIAVFSVLRVIL